ncbi:N/A [soil metagenome]
MSDSEPMVTGTDFVTLPTQDFEKAAAFYTDVLGLKPSKRWGDRQAGEFETGNLTIAIMQTDNFGIDFQPHGVPLALHVADVAASRELLEARGVEFLGETIDSGVCLQALFKDPDGNMLDLHHRYAPEE